MKIKLYIACNSRPEFKAHAIAADRLARDRGIETTSQWVHRVEGAQAEFTDSDAFAIQSENVADMEAANTLLLLCVSPIRGAAFECGYMLARGAAVHAVGSWQIANTLMVLDARVRWHATIADAVDAIAATEAA